MPVGIRRVLNCLSLLIIPALAPTAAHSLPRSRPTAEPALGPRAPRSLPYLTVIGAPTLRFQRPTPPPDLVTRPTPAAPPIPKLTPTEIVVAQNNIAAAHSTVEPLAPPVPSPETIANTSPDAPDAPAAPPEKPSILPDETRRPIRPEDFLPYFQIPGAANAPAGSNVMGPAPVPTGSNSSLPPSSATYTQTPK